MSATLDTTVTVAVEGGWEMECTRRVFGDRTIGVIGPVVFDAGLELSFAVSANESATFEVDVPVTVGFAYDDGTATNLSDVSPTGTGTGSFGASVSVALGAAVTTSAKAFGVVGIEIGVGPEVTASVATPACISVDLAFVLSIEAVAERWGIGWSFDLGSITLGPWDLYRSAACDDDDVPPPGGGLYLDRHDIAAGGWFTLFEPAPAGGNTWTASGGSVRVFHDATEFGPWEGLAVWRVPTTPGRYTLTLRDYVGEERSVTVRVLDEPDADKDGVVDRLDNCVNFTNRNQSDMDGDGIGDVCDPTPWGTDTHGYGVQYVVVDQNGYPIYGNYVVGGRLGDVDPQRRWYTNGYGAAVIRYIGDFVPEYGPGAPDLDDLVAQSCADDDCFNFGCTSVAFPEAMQPAVGTLHVEVVRAQCTQNQ